MSQLICDACGSNIPARSKFCGECGDPVTTADLSVNQVAEMETVKLVCPKCDNQKLYQISADGSARLSCPSCSNRFEVRVVEIKSKRSKGSKKDGKRFYTVRVKTLAGRDELIEFNDDSYADFEMKSKDLVAFIYRKNELSVVQNLTLRNYMKISRGCFLATAVYGPTAVETNVLRGWRDGTLRRSELGIWFIRSYYLVSPLLAKNIHLVPFGPCVVRSILSPFVSRLQKRAVRIEE